jgi:hypothetical protein
MCVFVSGMTKTSSKKKKSESGGPGNRDFVSGSGVNYSTILDHRVDDSRHERQKAYKAKELEEGNDSHSALLCSLHSHSIGLSLASNSSQKKPVMSSTFDAFMRMATGKEGRKIADKTSDPNRPTWEEYKKVNEDKLDMVGQEIRKMTEYRAELDKERERKLSARRDKKRKLYSDSEGEDGESGEEDDRSDGEKRKKSKKEKKSKKDKKKKDKVTSLFSPVSDSCF